MSEFYTLYTLIGIKADEWCSENLTGPHLVDTDRSCPTWSFVHIFTNEDDILFRLRFKEYDTYSAAVRADGPGYTRPALPAFTLEELETNNASTDHVPLQYT